MRSAIAFLLLGTGAAAASGPSVPEALIEAGHWKQARTIVEARYREAPDDALANFLLSQIRNAFGDRQSPLPLAEKAAALDGNTAKYHRQVAEVLGVMAEHANMFQQLLLARRFRREIDTALSLDPHDIQALRDDMEFYLLAPGIAGGDVAKAAAVARRIADVDAGEGFLAQARLSAFRKDSMQTWAFFHRAVEADPGSYRARMALVQFDLSPGRPNPAEVEQQARQALALDPNREEAYGVLAVIYADRGAWSELEAVLAEAERRVPDDLTPRFRAAERLLAAQRDLPRAERYLRAYLDAAPEGNQPTLAEARRTLGLVLKAEGRSEKTEIRTEQARAAP